MKEALDKGEPILVHQPTDHLTKMIPMIVELVQIATIEYSLFGSRKHASDILTKLHISVVDQTMNAIRKLLYHKYQSPRMQ
jgi:hypothetical protein